MPMINPKIKAEPVRLDQQVVQLEMDRRLTDHLIKNALKDPVNYTEFVASERPSPMVQYLAIMALIPLLVIAGVYSFLFDNEVDR